MKFKLFREFNDNNNYNYESSCYFLDLRNSTSIIRQIAEPKSIKSAKGLRYHAEMMIKIYEEALKIIKEFEIKEFYINDTGDGHLCLVRGSNHAIFILNIVCRIAEFTKPLIKEYNNEIEKFIPQNENKLKLDFGIGIHSGGSILIDKSVVNRNFAYGIVINSASRVEAFTKNFPYKLLFTGFFRNRLKKQIDTHTEITSIELLKHIKCVTRKKVDIKDHSRDGHTLYTIQESHWPAIANWFQ